MTKPVVPIQGDREAAAEILGYSAGLAVSAVHQRERARLELAFAHHRTSSTAELLEALEPFLDFGPQKGAWGIINKKLDGMAPLTLTVTKAQMLAAVEAVARAKGEPA